MKYLQVSLCVLALAALLAGWSGCGGGEHPLAPVKGKIVFQGQPVKGGSVTFRPLGTGSGAQAANLGKPATAMVQDDGTFVLSTMKQGDGAVVGNHEVIYTASFAEVKGYEDKRELPPWAGAVPTQKQVEVKSGSNDFTIDLVKPSQPAGGAAAPAAGPAAPATK